MSERPGSAPKVSRQKIRRLFEGDARAMLDEDLAEDVTYSLYARCASLLEVRGVEAAQVAPPRARRVVERPTTWEGFVKRQRYPWEIAWQEDFEAPRRTPLEAGGDLERMAYFVTRAPRARSAREKMLLVSRLLYECWESLQGAAPPGQPPLAAQLIAGNEAELRALFAELAYGPGADER